MFLLFFFFHTLMKILINRMISDTRLFESANTLRGENLQLTIANEKLRCEVTGAGSGTGVNSAIEARLLAQAEELANLHKRRGEHTQQIVDLNNKLQEMQKEFQAKEARFLICYLFLAFVQLVLIILEIFEVVFLSDRVCYLGHYSKSFQLSLSMVVAISSQFCYRNIMTWGDSSIIN